METFNKAVSTPAIRYHALDGLRGLAALLVIIHHCVLVSPSFFDAYKSEGEPGPLVWALTYTPIHLAWAGSEAVYVFFILSGFVLTLPFLRSSPPKWRVYYPKRLVRIYLPVWGSIIFALVMAYFVPRIEDPEYSGWINVHAADSAPLRDAMLIRGVGVLNSPLWSLYWEILFSLLLPVYLFFALRFKKLWILWMVVFLAIIAVASELGEDKLVYLPMFGVGVLMAIHKEQMQKWARGMLSWTWTILIAVCILLLTSKWMIPDVPALNATAVLGGAIALFSFMYFAPAVRFGERPSLRWLGKISFSLYLIHEPIVVSVALALETTSPIIVFAISLPLSLLVAVVFFRLIEDPSRKLADRVGRAFQKQSKKEAAR